MTRHSVWRQGPDNRLARWCVVLAGVVAPLGCGSGSTPDPKPAPPRPEAEVAPERFAKVVDEIRRRLKSSSQSPPVNVGGPLIAWKTTVSEELIPPPSEGLAWRGEITIATKSSVTVISAPQADDEDEVANDSRSASDALFDSIETRSESEIEAALDELSASAGAASQSRTPVMQVIDDDEINVYKLIFEDRRWRLTTPLDEETEIGLIFRIALRSQ